MVGRYVILIFGHSHPSNQLQIKNTVQLACALASKNNGVVTFSYLQTILEWGNEFHTAFQGHGAISNLQSYT
jgi:hypothetical protein